MIRENASLEALNTFRVKAMAGNLVAISSLEEILRNHDALFAGGLPLLVLGGGSNILFTKDFSGTVLLNCIKGMSTTEAGGDSVILSAGAGEEWSSVVEKSVYLGLWGIENLAGIPGTAGGAVVGNIGAYGAEIKDIFEGLDAYDPDSRSMVSMDGNACGFGYRDSALKRPPLLDRLVVCGIRLRLRRTPRPRLEYEPLRKRLEGSGVRYSGLDDIVSAVTALRRERLPDPSDIGSAGSFFKNPVIPEGCAAGLGRENPGIPIFPAGAGFVKCPAAWLIEKCGWKGRRRGRAGVYEKHSLVLVNLGGASGGEILELAKEIQASVQERFCIFLEPEVRII